MGDFNRSYSSLRTDKGLMAKVIDGVINKTENIKKMKTADEMNGLGKEAFLQLLCAQMENQDPLDPQSNTEWVSQLATYSSLEQMQNMNATIANSQAFSLMGQEVILATKDSNGRSTTISGVVDFVSVKGNKAYLSIKGNLYPASDLQSVIDPRYLHGNMLPKVEKGILKVDHKKPQDVSFKVSLGGELGRASGVAISIMGKDVDARYVKVNEAGVVTVSYAAFKDLKPGKYPITVKFNNDFKTEDSKSLGIVISDGEKKPEEKTEPDKKPEPDKKAEPDKKMEPDKKTESDKKTEPDKKAEPDKKTSLI